MDDATLASAADWYVDHGFGIFPIAARGKEPVTEHGVNDWTDNSEDVHAYWVEHPRANIGIACGSPSNGVIVLDVDEDEEKDVHGLRTLNEWEKLHGALPETATAITGRGGIHYFYRTDRSDLRPFINQDKGVDLRSDGAYVVAPPSIHPNGNRYEWQDPPDETPIATADANVYDFIDYLRRNGGDEDESKRDESGKFKLPDKIKKGERNDVLFRYAAHLRAIGRGDEEILSSVAGANVMRCTQPLDSRDVERIVRSACRYERGESTDELPDVGRPGGGSGAKVVDASGFRDKHAHILTNKLGARIIQENHACLLDGAPAVWTGTHWEFGIDRLRSIVLEYADDAKKATRDEVADYIMSKAPYRSSDEDFDGRAYVQFRNATYCVDDGGIVTPTPDMMIVGSCNCDLDLGIGRNEADEFLESIAGHDPDTIIAMQQVIGACMCSSHIASQSAMLIGMGSDGLQKASNGKSTYISFIRAILGKRNCSAMDIATLGERFQAAMVVGKLANLGDDIPNNFLSGTELSIFKKLVTGDEIYTDVKGSRGFQFTPAATMVFSMNSMPRLGDITDGVMRRLAFIPFRNKFSPGMPGYDPAMGRKLARPEVKMRGAVLGLQALPELIDSTEFHGIPDMVEAVEEVRRDNDSVRRWMYDEEVLIDALDKRPVAAVYSEYVEWCRKSGEAQYVSKPTFSRRVCSVTNVTQNGVFRVKTDSIRPEGYGRTARCFVRYVTE